MTVWTTPRAVLDLPKYFCRLAVSGMEVSARRKENVLGKIAQRPCGKRSSPGAGATNDAAGAAETTTADGRQGLLRRNRANDTRAPDHCNHGSVHIHLVPNTVCFLPEGRGAPRAEAPDARRSPPGNTRVILII
ncbi:hypothetical protein J6590_027735 [Homalodisca vitripennis]|nr:hypothetical protein J6590_027735 [Homalodisca vitripennis]